MVELTRDQRTPDVIAPSLEKACIDITWLDHHQSSYGFELLRWSCPCAICRGEGGTPGVLASTERLTPDQRTLVDVGPVGNYAMTITWKDGHSTGIYSWEYLRRLCPCPACSTARGAKLRE
ncbi:MAG: gamma-butyrobetaine hydroxylase-like domain-containing protein [Chloroflexota bacterium]